MQSPPFGTCAHCGDRIGVYEPVVVIAGEATRTTSLVKEPQLSEHNGVILMHQACAAGRASG